MQGYVFASAEAITPYLEEPEKGPTSQFCESLAQKLRCYVIAGYPEGLNADERGSREDGSAVVGANSAIIYDRQGKFLGGYRKGNLFETDKTWAKPGEEIIELYEFNLFLVLAFRRPIQIMAIDYTETRFGNIESRNLHGPQSATADVVDSKKWAL